MELNETVSSEETQPVFETTEAVVETVEPVSTMPPSDSESRTYEVMIVDVQRPFLETDFMDYTVTEGLLLLIFVIVLLQFFYGLVRR